MTGYKLINLDRLCEVLGEDVTEGILSTYSCPYNKDIEDFLKHKALTFSKQSLAKTHLVIASYKGDTAIAGYFTLANKQLFIPDKNRLGRNLRTRLGKFAQYIPETKMSILTAPLIAQLGKNYAGDCDKLISGDELLKMACDEIQRMQLSFGGKVAYLECEDTPKLISFYEANGFRRFSERVDGKGVKLIQMIKYFS